MRRLFISAVVVLVAAVVPALAQERLADQLRKGIVEEEASQNLDKAIQSYQAIVARYDEDRKAAGTAMFRLAECYRKAGKREQAIATYQRVVREFGDQAAVAAPSRQQLTALGAAEPILVGPSTVREPRSRPARVTGEARTEARPLVAGRGQSREVVPDRIETPREVEPDLAQPSTTDSLAASRIQLTAAQMHLADMEKRFNAGLVSTSDVQSARTQVLLLEERIRQQEQERELTQRMIQSVAAEIQLVRGRVTELETAVSRGNLPYDDAQLLQLRRDLLSLQRKLDELRLSAKR